MDAAVTNPHLSHSSIRLALETSFYVVVLNGCQVTHNHLAFTMPGLARDIAFAELAAFVNNRQ